MTEKPERKDDNTSVRVAIRVRPQNAKERIDICQVCTTVPNNEPQVLLGKDKSFTFDHVYDMDTVQETIYNTCVRHLIDGCFDGYNATVFAYGQTGSGKTYTMGTGFDVNTPQAEVGIIPRAVDHLFQGIESRRKAALANDEPPPDFRVNAQFMELYNEEILDLLDTTRDPESRGRKSHIKIHEDAAGGIYVVGVTTRTVVSLEDTMKCLNIGALSRATASTNMNVQSSRCSHAIFTLHIKQHRMVKEEPLLDEGKDTDSTQSINEFETLTAKFHFVDLAGSERLKRTGATGERAKEGISINCGLLALGNVISALGDKLKKGSHVPYRDSKLTRLLQDSLGGNSRTLMIACISPSDRDFMETLNTLKYANRAKNIKNKVIANQDKASKQMAALRTEIATLQQELIDYKAGKLVVGSDGVGSMSDLHHENNMLLMENDKLRQRVKALNDTVETMKARNSQLLAEKAVLAVTGANGETSNEEVTNLITGYVKELEDLRAKLAESSAMVTHAQKYSVRSPSRLMVSPMSTTFPSSGGFDYPLSPDNSVMALIVEAKKDVKKLKKVKRSKSRQSNQGSDKENEGEEGGGEMPAMPEGKENGEEEVGEVEHEESQEKSEDEEDDEEDIEDDDEEDTTEDEVSSSESDSEDKVELFLDYGRFWSDSDHIHEDLAELTCEITIKQRLIEELEHSQKKVHAIKQQYEEKVIQLQQRIKETEIERDKILSNVGQLESVSNEKQKKVKDEFAKKLGDLQMELKKMQAAKREHAKMVRNQSHFEKQLKTLQHEMQEMKKTKVRLMKQIKEDGEKNKQSETRRNKEIAQMRREFTRKENRIRNLEREKNQKEQVLRRKQEEVEALRKRQKPLSSRAAGRIGKYEKAPTIPIDPISTSSPRRRRRNEFSPKAAKQKWDIIEKNVGSVITKRQTISHMEKDMDVWLKQREKLSKKLEKFVKKRDSYIALQRSAEIVRDLGDQIQSLKNQIEYVQDNINECQTNIMQMEEAKEETENLDVGAVISTVSLEEAKYLLEHFLQLSINKGMALALKDSESKELLAKLHQTELNNTLQQDLLKHMMMDHVDIEVDNLMSNNDELDEFDIESCTTSASSSPAERAAHNEVARCVQMPGQSSAALLPINILVTKARRKTATPEDLLYAGGPQEGCPPLLPVLETPDEDKEILWPVKEELEGMPVNGTDTVLMPPPKSLAVKPNSSIPRPMSGKRPDSGPSPSLRRKEFKRNNSPEPSPVMRRKNYSDRYGSRSSSIDTSSDTTPPTSPPALRRSGRSSDENVFSRLTSNPQSTSPNPNRGSIVSVSGRPSSGRSSPLTCTHTAEGHTKAVLAVHATDDLLFTGSKDRTAKTWDLVTGKEILAYTGHPNNVGKVKYCEATKLAFTVSQSFIKVWDIRSKSAQCIKTLGSSGLSVTGPANQTYQSRQTDLAPGEHHINDIALGSDGVTLYCATGNIVRVWDLRRYSAVGKLSGGHQAAVMVLAVDASTDSSTVITGSKDHYIKVFEVMDDAAGVFTPKYNLEPPHYDGIQSLALHGSMLFSGSRDTCIKKWDLKDQQLKQSMNAAHKDWVCALDFMPGGNFLLSACRGGILKLWQMDSCAQIAEIKAHSSPINAISTNSTSIFTASNEPVVKIWQLRRTNSLRIFNREWFI
ncbi:kinesin-like protein KIF21A isoform X3 [Haliotis rubra]|uniref:kinesin-like protein KIF21A isoform X3 n=1 Tax=Haliotis rubra TaxID=36100 RepID=UPI001EE59D86|nr:kinesin-like protein KIF21A isoform X3 [Haliotis rubra]